MPRSSSNSNAPATTRKRSDASDEGEEGVGKKRSRGRPRLDTKDETAADRRRTQIRLAQRAYRNRKDTAIDTLKQRVKELEKVNEDMGNEFMSLSQFVLGQGVFQRSPEIAQRLNEATRKFISLQRQAAEETSANTDTDAGGGASPDDGTVNLADKHTQLAIHQQPGSKKSSSSSTSSNDVLSTPNTEWSTEDKTRSGVPIPFQHYNHSSQYIVNPVTNHSMRDSSFPIGDSQVQVPLFTDPFSQSPFIPPPMPSSYGAHEQTFGRRLQRTILEAGLRLASMDNPPPDRYMAVFSFCLYFESGREIVTRLSSTLEATAQETLNHWKFPFTNLGGSGLYFSDSQGNGIMPGNMPAGGELPIGNHGLPEPYKPSEMTGFSMGPFSREIELAKDYRIDHRLRMIEPGFEGEFFDADEVETYLRQHGIVIPANKDFVDAEIDLHVFDEDPPPTPWPFTLGKEGFFKQPPPPPTQNPGVLSLSPDFADAPGNLWPGTQPPTTIPFEAPVMMGDPHAMPAMDPHLAPLVPDLSNRTSATQFNQTLASFEEAPEASWRDWGADTTWRKTKVTIDVNQLVTKMTNHAVCLGRSPGVRPRDVHKAVKQSIILQHGVK